MNLKYIAAGIALASSSSAFAGATANAGVFSEYMFRGVEQTGGAAVQGGLDYASDIGLYIGTWVSNTSFAGYSASNVSYETDIYGGFTKKWGNFGIDVGALYYYYRDDSRLNTIEGYFGVLLGPAAIKAYYTPAYFGAEDASGDDEDGLYLTANVAIPLSDTLALTPQVGYSKGDGVRDFVVVLFEPVNPGDDYLDYSVTLAKTLDAGFTFTFALVGSDLEDDKEKLVVGLKKSFDL